MLKKVIKAITNIRFFLTRDRAIVSKLAKELCEELSQLSLEDLRRVQTLPFDDAEEESIIKDVIIAFIIGQEDDIIFQRLFFLHRLRERRLRMRTSLRVKQKITSTREEAESVPHIIFDIARIEDAASQLNVNECKSNSFGIPESGSEYKAEDSLADWQNENKQQISCVKSEE